ncbi:hypothetical protein ACRAWF_25815 [Streptomyces sp. L7]
MRDTGTSDGTRGRTRRFRRGIVLAPADPSQWSHSHRLVDSLEARDRRRLGLALLSSPHDTRGDICMEAALTRHPCGWSPEEAEELLALALPEIDHIPCGFHRVCRCLGLPLAAVREQEPSERARYRPRLRAVVLGARNHHHLAPSGERQWQCRWHLSVEEAGELLDLPYDREVLKRLPQVLPDRGTYSNRALTELGTLVFEPGVLDLLAVFLTIDSYRPAQSWLGQVRERLELLTVAPEVVGTLLRTDTSRPDDRMTESELSRQAFVLDQAKLLAGAAWAACLTGDPALIGLVAAQVLGRSRDRRLPGVHERDVLPVRAGVTALSAAAGMPGLGRHRRAPVRTAARGGHRGTRRPGFDRRRVPARRSPRGVSPLPHGPPGRAPGRLRRYGGPHRPGAGGDVVRDASPQRDVRPGADRFAATAPASRRAGRSRAGRPRRTPRHRQHVDR